MIITDLKLVNKGKDCVILTCGPSLIEYDKKMILDFCKNKIVICVKEAILEYGDISHYLFANGTRLRDFNLREYNTINIYQDDLRNSNKYINQYDIIVKEAKPFKIKKQLLKTKRFNKWDFNNTLLRPWGPGILYESVFYFCDYIGCKNVYTIGWDLIDTINKTTLTHYFDDDKSNKYDISTRWNNHNFLKEMKMVNKDIPYMYDYFKKKGMNLYVIGEMSFVNKKIPRITI